MLDLWYVNVALAISNNASPVHNNACWVEACVDNAVLIASSVDLKSLKEFGVLLGNWLNNFTVVELDLLFSILDDLDEFLLVLLLVGFHLVQLSSAVLLDLLYVFEGLVNEL